MYLNIFKENIVLIKEIVSIIAIIIGGLWIFFKFIFVEIPVYIKAKNKDLHLKPAINSNIIVSQITYENETFLLIKVELTNQGTQIGSIIRHDASIFSFKMEDNIPIVNKKYSNKCRFLEGDIFAFSLYPQESTELCYISPSLKEGTYYLKIVIFAGRVDKNTHQDNEIIWEKYDIITIKK